MATAHQEATPFPTLTHFNAARTVKSGMLSRISALMDKIPAHLELTLLQEQCQSLAVPSRPFTILKHVNVTKENAQTVPTQSLEQTLSCAATSEHTGILKRSFATTRTTQLIQLKSVQRAFTRSLASCLSNAAQMEADGFPKCENASARMRPSPLLVSILPVASQMFAHLENTQLF